MTTEAIDDRACDVREGGSWTRPQRLKNALIVGVVRVLLVTLAPLPRAFLRVIGRGVGLFALVVLGRARRTAMTNLLVAFPSATASARRALLRRVYWTLGGQLGDALSTVVSDDAVRPLPIDPTSLELLTDCAGGVLFASAHLGPWERVAQSLVAHGVPLTVLAREAYDPRLSQVYERLRTDRGVAAIYRGHAGAAARIVRTLRGGGVLGIPMDLKSRVPSIDVLFLGRLAPTPVGPARIALRTGAKVVVGSIAPDGSAGGIRITCTRIPTEDIPSQDDRERERIVTARINAELTSRILALPTSWVWMHDRFGAAIPVD